VQECFSNVASPPVAVASPPPPSPVAATVQIGGYTRTTFVGAPQEAFVSAVSTSFEGAPVVVTSLARRRRLADTFS
jgi:hypothetical protein